MVLLLHVLLVFVVLRRTTLFSQCGLGTFFWMLLIGLKAVAGYALIAYYDSRYGGSDMRGYLTAANAVHTLVIDNPAEGLRLLAGLELSPGIISQLREQIPMWFGRSGSVWFSDSRNFIRMHALLRFVSNGDIWIHLLWINFASLAGGVALIRFFLPYREQVKTPLWAVGLLFIPNGLLWSSTILKEPLLLVAMGFTLLYARKWLDSGFTKHGHQLLFSLLLFLLIKPFWMLAFLPGLLGWAIFRGRPSASAAVAVSYILALLLAMSAGALSSDFHLPSLLYGEQRNMWRFAVFGGAGSLMHPIGFAPTWISLFKHAPEAFLVAMSQPFPSGWSDWTGFFLFSENILFLAILSAVLVRRGSMTRIRTNPSLILACFAGITIVLVSAFTTPVAGTLIRYRWPGVLLLMLALFTAVFAGPAQTEPMDRHGRQD